MLRCISDDERAQVLMALKMRLRKNLVSWDKVALFVAGAWPRELALRTADAIVRAIAELVTAADDHFPDAVTLLGPWLRPIRQPGLLLHQWSRTSGQGTALAERFPDAVLMLANAVVGDEATYGLSELVEQIARAKPKIRQAAAWRRLAKVAGVQI